MDRDTGLARKPAVAGQFYPRDPVALDRDVRGMLERAPTLSIEGDVRALIAPHAGYIYSGSAAASAYKQVVRREFDAVVVIAPSHHEDFPGVSVYRGDAYLTPLGSVPVAHDLIEQLVEQNDCIHVMDAGHRYEHALEVQLPFLQVALGGSLSIVPIVMADRSQELCCRLGEAIAETAEGKILLIVASSDLYHGYSYDACVQSDTRTLAGIEAFNPEGFCGGLERGIYQACGGGPITAALIAAREMGANSVKILHSINSNDVTGERGGYVVGYGAAVVYRANVSASVKLSHEEHHELLTIAHTAIEASVRGEPLPEPTYLSEPLKELQGAFVTIRKEGSLRGCIGYVEALKPLYQTVQEAAEASALRDPRFSPITEEELPLLTIEVSVLTPPIPIGHDEVQKIQIGRHGLIIRRGYRHGLLLPQVAAEYSWDPLTFLEQTCRKAGLSKDAWKNGETEIEIFSADVFGS
ncbi:MAG: AmmeMemoRadiSam system protein B [Candidatus Latescibacteria bacterium]|nr:AmmeMemoRadiSam system protein B [Candidatus Latescibacterota bacterium]